MNATPNARPPLSLPWREVLAVALLLALVCVLAWPGMSAPWLLDDLDQMSHVSRFTSWKDCVGRDCYGFFRPVKNLIFFSFGHLHLFPWHALNLAIYLVAIGAVYLLLRRLLDSRVWALAAVTLWATCPTQASSAVWMSCVNISVAITLACACLYFHDRSQAKSGHKAGWTVLTCLGLFLAQCSYETAVSVPALCILVDALRKRPLLSRAAILHYALLAAVTLTYLAIRASVGAVFSLQTVHMGFAPDTQGWQLAVSAPWFLWRHFSMWLMPAGRIEFCGNYIWGISAAPWELAAAWGWLLLLIGSVWLTWKRQPWLAFGVLWFLIASFPTSNFIPLWTGPIADYYLIFPGIGLAIALVGCAKGLLDWMTNAHTNPESQRPLIGGALLCFIALWRVLCVPLFWLQASLWCRPLDLYLQCELTRPAQYQLQALAAQEVFRLGDFQQAKELAEISHATAPWHGISSMILASIALEAADYDQAEKHFHEVLRNTPADSSVYAHATFSLAKTFMAQESKRKLVRETLLPLLTNPYGSYHLKAINLQLDCYLAENQPNAAHSAAAKAVQLHPQNTQLMARLKDIEEKSPASVVSPPPPK